MEFYLLFHLWLALLLEIVLVRKFFSDHLRKLWAKRPAHVYTTDVFDHFCSNFAIRNGTFMWVLKIFRESVKFAINQVLLADGFPWRIRGGGVRYIGAGSVLDVPPSSYQQHWYVQMLIFGSGVSQLKYGIFLRFDALLMIFETFSKLMSRIKMRFFLLVSTIFSRLNLDFQVKFWFWGQILFLRPNFVFEVKFWFRRRI